MRVQTPIVSVILVIAILVIAPRDREASVKIHSFRNWPFGH
jgi:hypothetical protein